MELPSNLQAERGLLGIIINHNDSLFDVSSFLLPEDFWEPWHGELFRLCKDQIETGRAVTAVTLMTDAEDADIGGITAKAYLRKLEDEAPISHAIARELARAIKDAAVKRHVIEACNDIAKFASAAPVSISAAEIRIKADEILSKLFGNAEDLGLRRAYDIGEGILEAAKATDRPAGIEVGLAALQSLIGAPQPGRTYYVAGGPGSGKSALLLQVCSHVASAGGVVVLFSPEMEDEEVVERELAARSGVKAERIERLLLDRGEYERVWEANEQLKEVRLFIDRGSAPSIASIRAKALRLKRLMGRLDMVAIDHIHYVAPPDRKMNDYSALDANCMAAKSISKDLRVPMLVACQLRTEALNDMAKWPHRRPTQGDLLFSGVIDRNADAIVLVHRDEYFLRRTEPDKNEKHYGDWSTKLMDAEGKAILSLSKRRGGVGWGTRVIGFDAERGRFLDDLRRIRQQVVEDEELFAFSR